VKKIYGNHEEETEKKECNANVVAVIGRSAGLPERRGKKSTITGVGDRKIKKSS